MNMRIGTALATAAMMLLSSPALARAPSAPEAGKASRAEQNQAKALEGAGELVAAGRPAEAIARLDGIIAYYDAAYGQSKSRIFCARTPAETLMYLAMSASLKQDGIVLDSTWADALYLKGYSLIELGRAAEAKDLLDRALALSPHNSQYLSEIGQLQQTAKDWPAAMASYERAAGAAEISPPNVKTGHLTRAWRGTGFVLVELGRLDEAEEIYLRCLKLDPGDRRAASELQYVREAKTRAKAGPGGKA